MSKLFAATLAGLLSFSMVSAFANGSGDDETTTKEIVTTTTTEAASEDSAAN
jgi:hypothetical protein